MRRPFVLAVAAVVAAGVLAACGGDTVSLDDYTETVVTTRDRVEFALAQITVGQGTFDELVTRMEAAADRIDSAADDLDDADTADGFDDETDRLVGAFHELAAGLSGTAHDASQPGMEGLLAGTNALQFPGWNQANRVLASLKEQGIAVEPISSQ